MLRKNIHIGPECLRTADKCLHQSIPPHKIPEHHTVQMSRKRKRTFGMQLKNTVIVFKTNTLHHIYEGPDIISLVGHMLYSGVRLKLFDFILRGLVNMRRSDEKIPPDRIDILHHAKEIIHMLKIIDMEMNKQSHDRRVSRRILQYFSKV